jgi:hypothetical protein
MTEFWIDRKGTLTANGEIVGRFGCVEAAADMAVRFSQDNDIQSYRIFYPL